MSKIWTILEIEHLIKTNDKMVINTLVKLEELDLIHHNGFIQSTYDQYKNKGYLSNKQLKCLRYSFLNVSNVITDISNNIPMEESNIYGYGDISNMYNISKYLSEKESEEESEEE